MIETDKDMSLLLSSLVALVGRTKTLEIIDHYSEMKEFFKEEYEAE